ncbi:MAG TPA: DUF6801 domain-containing protein [Nocardioides sp.]|nr:DUF6801 domain-containing protein [Nocardioides sp.]
MSMRPRARLRTIAAGAAVTLAAGSAAVLGTASPASASTLNFDCAVPLLGTQTFPVDINSSAPSQLPTGSSTTPDITAVLTIPATLADTLRGFFGATEFSGVIHSTTLVDGVAQVVDLIVPTTPAGDAGTTIPVAATGALDAITAGDPGSVTTLAAGDQDVVMSLVGTGGTTPLDIPCTPSPGQDTTLGTITSVKDGSSTAATARYLASKHAVKAAATVASAHGIVSPTGNVKFVLKRGTHKVASMTKTLSGGKASATFTSVRRTGAYKVIAKYLGSDRLKASKDTASFRVR